MADSHPNAALLSPQQAPHPLANPGYGKRSATGQRPRTAEDFNALVPRDAAIAAYIDRLPDGSDISAKTLAKHLPYGQCAVRTSLNRMQDAGHLRRGSEHYFGTDGCGRWVTRTWFSRTARDDAWWAAFVGGDAPDVDAPQKQRPTRTRAYILLAALGRETPAMSLSARDCAELEPLAAQWLERGASVREVTTALTAGLPHPVHSPSALARTRLTSKLPPERIVERPPLRVLECSECGLPARPDQLPGGRCAPCRGHSPRPPATTLPPETVRAHAAQARAAASRPLARMKEEAS